MVHRMTESQRQVLRHWMKAYTIMASVTAWCSFQRATLSHEVDATNYLESCKANAVQSPAQAWNALTVGAYTEKTIVTDESYKALAAPGICHPCQEVRGVGEMVAISLK